MSADPPLRRADPVTVARQLGWTNVEIVEDDLSRSAAIARPQPSPIYAGAYAFGRPTRRLSVPYVGGEALVLAARPIWRQPAAC
jgi:hypothetical protein